MEQADKQKKKGGGGPLSTSQQIVFPIAIQFLYKIISFISLQKLCVDLWMMSLRSLDHTIMKLNMKKRESMKKSAKIWILFYLIYA